MKSKMNCSWWCAEFAGGPGLQSEKEKGGMKE